MKVKCITKCTGTGYENFEPEEVREVPEELGELLIKFKYAKLVGKGNDKQQEEEPEEESKVEELKDEEESTKKKINKAGKKAK